MVAKSASCFSIFVCLFCQLWFGINAKAQLDAMWDNSVGNWSDAPRWSTANFPDNGNGGFDFNASIAGGSPTVDQLILIESLQLSGGTLNFSGFNLSADSFSFWSGGTLTGLGSTNLNAGADFSGTTKTLSGNHVLNNAGISSWSAGQFNTGQGSEFNNLPGATFDIIHDGNFSYNLGGSLSIFNNEGLVTKSVTSGTTLFATEFNNDGVIDIVSGTLRLAGGGTSNGSFAASAGSSIEFGGNAMHQLVNSPVSGDGEITVAGGTLMVDSANYDFDGTTRIAGGTIEFNSDAETFDLTLSSGSRGGPGILDVGGLFSWTGGSLSGPGTTNSTLATQLSGQTKTLSGGHTFNSAGAIAWTGGSFNTGGGATINNLSGAIFETDFDGTIAYNLGGIPLVFNNLGTFIKNGGVGSTSIMTTFNNVGTVNVEESTLNLGRGGTSSGLFLVGSGATLRFSGTASHQLGVGSEVCGSGEVEVASGSTDFATDLYDLAGTSRISGGTANFNSIHATSSLIVSAGQRNGTGTVNVEQDLVWTGGSFTGAGTTNCNGSAELSGTTKTLSNQHTLNNSGSMQWTAGSINSGQAAEFINLPGATFETDFDGSISYNLGGTPLLFRNSGTFLKSGGSGVTSIGTTFDNDGQVDVDSGTLRLSRGGTSTGAFVTSADATLEFAGSTLHEISPGSSITGLGAVLVSQGTTQFQPAQFDVGMIEISGGNGQIDSNALTDTMLIDSGTRSGTGTVTVDTVLEWIGGTFSGPGQTQSTGLLLIDGGTLTLSNGHTFENFGDAQWNSGNFNTGTGAVFVNRPGGFFEILTDGAINFNLGGDRLLFNNEGTLTKGGPGGTAQLNVDFQNSGELKCNSGDLLLQQGMTQTAGLTFLGGGTLNCNASRDFKFLGGSIEGAGLVATLGDIDISNTTIRPGDNGLGEIELEATNSLINDGTILEIEIGGVSGTPGVNWDSLSFTGDLTFDGSGGGFELRLVSTDANGNQAPVPGFDPTAQYSFPIATASTINGFDCADVFIDVSEFQNPLSASFRIGVDTSGPDDMLVLEYGSVLLGDVNGDGSVSLADIPAFVTVLSSGQFNAAADINCDGAITLADIPPFVALLAAP